MPTILLVDDSVDVLRLLSRGLELRGYKVLAAPGGAEALEMAAGHAGPIELLVSDIRMPEMDGPELWARLSQIRPEMKCVFISGYPKSSMVREPFLAKPFTAAALVSKICEVLGVKEPARTQAHSA